METFGIDIQDKAVFLTLCGEITLEVTSDLKKKVDAALRSADFEVLVANMGEITFMDSSGIGFLVALNTRVMGMGKKMFLFMPSEQVTKTLELVQLNDFFHTLEHEDDLTAVLPI